MVEGGGEGAIPDGDVGKNINAMAAIESIMADLKPPSQG